MNIMTLIGGGVLLYNLAGKAAGTMQDNILYDFKSVKTSDFNFLEGKVRLTLMITNKNPIPFTVQSITGHVYFGRLSVPITQLTPFTTPANGSVDASFSFAIDNGVILEQLADQIISRELPQLRMIVSMTAGYKDKVVTIPVDTIIPML